MIVNVLFFVCVLFGTRSQRLYNITLDKKKTNPPSHTGFVHTPYKSEEIENQRRIKIAFCELRKLNAKERTEREYRHIVYCCVIAVSIIVFARLVLLFRCYYLP